MKQSEMLNQIKTLLNIEVKLEDMKLENGTVVSAESFEKGKELFIVTDDEKVAMPVGEYLLEDGRLIVVEEEGLIADVREVSDEVPAKETEEGEEITSDLKEKEETYAEESDMMKDMMGRIQNLEDAIADLKDDKKDRMEDVDEVKEEEMSDDSQAPLKSRTVKEEFSEEVLKEELSEASAKPIKHNPEAETKQIKKVEFGKGKFNTTLDRVLNKLNK
tara:strand:- start:3109 stop:3762 length:654 start_codon:yes stop_codon:yes gene_type:complete